MREALKSLPVGQILERSARLVPAKTAVVEGKTRKTYKELDELSKSLSASFSELGLRKGDRVAIYMKNSIELILSFYALQRLGVIVVWINPNYRKAETEYILRNSGAKGVILFREWEGYDYLQAVREIKKDLPELKTIIVVGEGEGQGLHRFSDLLAHGKDKEFSSPAIDTMRDLSMLIYTSGTTGKPKGAMITHYGACRGGFEYSQAVNATSDDTFIGLLPMTHSYGCGAVLIQPLVLQSTLVIMDKFGPERAFQLIEKEKVTLQPAAPTHYILELNHPRRKDYDLTSLRAGIIAGQIAPEGLITRVEKEMGVYLTSFWGASEVGPGLGIACPYPSPIEIRERYIGKPIPDTAVRIADPLTYEEVPDGQIGELTLSGWHVMRGYWKNEKGTQRQIINGWLFMGDLVSREEDGFLRIYGRTKDLINRGGYKIYPYELESLLMEHPKVAEACVVATPNPVLGESLCVCLIPKSEQSVSLSEIRQSLEGKIAPHKLPDELCIMKTFPRLSGGVKLNKFGKGGLTELACMDESRQRHRH
ncbi:MAG: acyl--CoA ligase [Proteobacteria bacterium]|nr:acyl--CoA ligase [Pseudomonadota bacterium]